MAVSIEHNLFPDLSPRAELFQKIALLEKSWLEGSEIAFPHNFLQIVERFQFFQILGTSAAFSEKSSRVIAKTSFDGFFSAAHNQTIPLVYLVSSDNRQLRLYIGTNAPSATSLSALFSGHLNPSLYTPSLEVNYRNLRHHQHAIALTGIPHLPQAVDADKETIALHAPSRFDRMLLGLHQKEWMYVVQAFPIPREQINGWFEQCAREVKDVKESFLLRENQKTNRTATYYIEVLEKTIQRLKRGKQQGLWQTGVYLLCRDSDVARNGAALLCSTYSGEKSFPEPVRCHVCREDGRHPPTLNSYHSGELQAFISLPGREFPGYMLQEQAVFDVDFVTDPKKPITLGRVADHGSLLNHQCSIPLDDLTMHGLVSGVTGSGKTSTIFHMLLELYREYKVPFLVIEPAKSEYRNLMRAIDSLLVFTLGEERPGISAPFRFNPFAFPPGISVQTHIDYLKAVFNASFVMYAPMPYVLDECLYRIYEDRGWNLVTSTNHRGLGNPAFPTLTDLYRKIDDVVDGLGYQDRTTMDIKAALKTRIRNLCLGGKGMMLDTVASISFGELLARPTVLELKYLGNDEEKTFMMGLILMALSEQLETVCSDEGLAHSGLRHLTVIEEAHRLLRNVPVEKASEEQSNIRGKGVETFCNLLAEIRAYGEGVLVSEQIPSKLAPDVIKNSNLKIMHRMVSKEDRDIMGDTMNLDSLQKRSVLSLGVGDAILFREGLDRPMMIKVPCPEVKREMRLVSGADVRMDMITRFYRDRPRLLKERTACDFCPVSKEQECELAKTEVREICAADDFDEVLVRCFFPYLVQPGRGEVRRHFRSILGLPADFEGARLHCLISSLIRRYLAKKGEFLEWTFESIENLVIQAESAIASEEFNKVIGLHCLRELNGRPVSPACGHVCNMRCLYAYEGNAIARDPLFHNRLLALLDTGEHNFRFYQELTYFIIRYLRDVLSVQEGRHLAGIAMCCLANKLGEIGLSVSTQQSILERFAEMAAKAV